MRQSGGKCGDHSGILGPLSFDELIMQGNKNRFVIFGQRLGSLGAYFLQLITAIGISRGLRLVGRSQVLRQTFASSSDTPIQMTSFSHA